MLSFAFLNIYPIQFHFLHFTVVFTGSCFVLLHNSMLLILSSQCVFTIFLNDLFMKVCNFCQLFFVNYLGFNTLLIVQLNILTFVAVEITSALRPPFLSITAPK
jgi:hypothetical protein